MIEIGNLKIQRYTPLSLLIIDNKECRCRYYKCYNDNGEIVYRTIIPLNIGISKSLPLISLAYHNVTIKKNKNMSEDLISKIDEIDREREK